MKRPIDIMSESKHSLVHIGSLDSFDLTKGGIDAAANIIRYFETGDKAYLEESVKAYDSLIPIENFGGEYSALRWICQLLLAPSTKETAVFLNEPTVASWYEYLKEDDFKKLKAYINYKYHFLDIDFETEEGREIARTLRFLEDFILFSNPDRSRWEKTELILEDLRIAEGLTVADVGCGSGYFTFKFADMVGPDGKVYGIEINPLHLDYLRKYLQRNDVSNVEIVESASDGIGLDPDIRVDVVFSCSLFHVLYAVFDEDSRRQFVESISRALNPGGVLIVVDNDLVETGKLPYHGPYIAKDLLISQMYHFGFTLLKIVQVTQQRYALVFEKQEALPDVPVDDMTDLSKGIITAMSEVSLVKYALADAVPLIKYSEKGKQAADLFLRALENNSLESIDAAIVAYEAIIPTERIGDEYTAFVWICEYLKADEQTRARMVFDPLAKEYHEYLSHNDYARLKAYLVGKYELMGETAPTAISGTGVAQGEGSPENVESNKVSIDNMDDMLNISEYIAFNNPARDRWEKTNLMLELIDARHGEYIADVGCGSGYFTYKFASLVGATGKVYATELNKGALSYVEAMRDKYDLRIEPIVCTMDDVKLPSGQFDKIFMCSMYHALYVSSIEFVKDAFVDSIKKALKNDGKLIIVDNDIKREGVPEYYGSAIDRRLIINQLSHYGFTLIEEQQFIPQRYVLVFRKSL